MSTPAFGCPFCSAIFAEEEQMLSHFLQESKDRGCSQLRGKDLVGPDDRNIHRETVRVEVGDDPSQPQVIAPDGRVLSNINPVIKEEIIVEEFDDDDFPDEDVGVMVDAELHAEDDVGCSLARSAGINIRVPPVKRASKIKYKKMAQELADMKKIGHILPVSQMQSILQYLSQHSDMVVETDVGSFDLHRIRYMDFLHQLHLNRIQIQEENDWFGEKLMMPFQCEESIDVEAVYRFHEVIQDNGCSASVGLPSCTALVSDLMCLPCDRWFTDGLLDCFAGTVRRSATRPTEVFNVTELSDVDEVCATLEERHPDRSGLQVIFLLHVGKAENEAAQQLPDDRLYSASHFSFALFSFDRNEVVYADTLGWSIPEPLYFMMDEFVAHFGLPEPTFSCLHDPESLADGETHTCSDKCSRLYPVEQADSAYGLAVVVGFCLAAMDREAFGLITARAREAELPNKLDYLQDITQYSKFLRLVLINWLMQGEISVAMLYRVLEDTPPRRAPRLSSRRRKKKVPYGASPENSPEREAPGTTTVGPTTVGPTTRVGASRTSTPPEDLNFENLSDLLTRAPEIGYLKNYSSLRVRFYLKNGKIVTKRFKCNGCGKRDQRALKKVQDYVDRKDVYVYLKHQSGVMPRHRKNWLRSRNEAVNAILLKAELVTQGSGSLRLRCTLKNGITKSKIYSGEKDDPKIRAEVLEFLSSRMCEEWLKEERKWIYEQEINTGVDTRTYVDAIPFDVKKKCIKVDRRVRPVSDAGTLSVSVEANPNWGRLHRYDETYAMKDERVRPRDRFVAVTMILQCASLTSECRSDCGVLLGSLATHGKLCSGCQLNLDSGRTCEGCFTTDSPHWYSGEAGATLCNACYRANGRRKTQRRKDKIHHPHLKCKWKLKFELDQDLKAWKVYRGAANDFYHHREPVGERKRPTWTERDVWDKARILTNATAHEIYNSMQRAVPLPSSDPGNATQALGQITRRCKSIDKKYLHLAMNWRKDPNPTCSDWRKAEKVLENNFEDVLHYQRGDNLLGRDYRIVLATDANLLALRDLGREVIGVDSKEDFMNGCFKTLYVTYCDPAGQEEVAVAALCNREAEDTYTLVFQMIASNIPCRDPACTHPKVLHVYNDENGFFWTRPCASKCDFQPLVQHENKNELRNAVTYMMWFSSLYNFNALETVRAQICALENTRAILAPAELGFKCVLMAWNNEMRKRLEHSYKEFLMNCVPDGLVSHASKEGFVFFLDKLWFETPWSDSYTCQVVFRVPAAYRKNGLLSVEHLPERKVREAEEPDTSARNKRMSHYVVGMLNKVLHRGIFQEQRSGGAEGGLDERKDREVTAIEKGFKLREAGNVACHPGWEEHGFISVTVENSDDTVTELGEEDEEEEVPIVASVPHAQKMLQIQLEEAASGDLNLTEHTYAVNAHLNALALDLYRQEILRYVPPRVRCNIKTNEHICNIHLRSCTCHSFIDRGQTELCKHLYAALIASRQLSNVQAVVSEASVWYPSIPVPLESHVNLDRTITLPRLMPNKVDCLLGMSRVASEKDLQLASQGEILRVLHDSPSSTSKNGSYRAQDGAIVVRKYAVTDLADPYCPNIDFPKSLRGRRSGRGGRKGGLKRSLETEVATEVVQEETKKMRIGSGESECQEFGENNVFYVTLPDDAAEELHEASGSEESREMREGDASVYNPKGFPSIVCGRCLDENKGSPQLCYSPAELQSHIDKEHPDKTLACAFCYFNNVSLRFATIKEFNEHMIQEH